jgi:excisionase family DNA binding protein
MENSMAATTNQSALSALLTAEEVSEYLDVPKGTLANRRHLGRGPAFVRLGRHIRYQADDLASWIERGKPVARSFR